MPLIKLAGLWSQKRLYVFVHTALKEGGKLRELTY